MSMELRVLRYVVAVADEGGFQAAADRLHMAQPPLSRQIRNLERELGVTLFERRPTRLTEAGAVFVESARRLLADAEAMVEQTRRVQPQAPVRLGYVASTAYETVPALMEFVPSECPGVVVDAREGWSPELEIALHDRRLDVVISHSIEPREGLDRFVLRREPLVAVVGETHRLAGRSAVSLRDLRGETFCFLNRQLAPAYHDHVVAALHSTGETFETWEHPVPGLRQSPLRGGEGFTVVCRSAAVRLLGAHAALELTDELPPVVIEAVWRSGALSAAAQRFLRAARKLSHSRSWVP
ncbi:LysR substrate-binding domain-containing protein [Amycolatopsis cynarae]|uniref:LysR substrate-binding domain-containing protein n=1 Tax=Amycolatopsis cynarae TaxID=2995223 RepID=A0ABY7AYR0_9PSEU|nr:LysR substrate-binding domain-containing protein [Amycolatopsis sp. HUAS 11-8]WAL63743.1 LysR substrate-binding domain-containing protein [Amycolatopsis sp. HUAS 11-8]